MRLFGVWNQLRPGGWDVALHLMPVPRSSPSRGHRPHHPTSIPGPALTPSSTGPKLNCGASPIFPHHPGHPFLPIQDVARGLHRLARVGSGCLPWLSPCLDFSPMTNACPGPSALPANSSVPSLPASLSSRLSALPENIPGHAARLHFGDLVTISSPRGSLFPSAGG